MLGAALACASPAAAQTITGYDSVTLSAIPSNAQAVGCYVGGWWPTCDAAEKDFPHAQLVTIAISASEHTYQGKPVDCLDIEPGDATVSQARGWDEAEIRLGEPHPCDYDMESQQPQLHAAVAGLPVLFWDAAYDGDPSLRGFDAHQWTDHALGRNLDGDTFSTKFLAEIGLPHAAVAVVIGGAQHYERYPVNYWRIDGQRMRERITVQTWDSHKCENPVRRSVCKSTRAHLALLLSRDQAVYTRQTKAQRDANHTPGRIQGIVHRLAGKGVVKGWL